MTSISFDREALELEPIDNKELLFASELLSVDSPRTATDDLVVSEGRALWLAVVSLLEIAAA